MQACLKMRLKTGMKNKTAGEAKTGSNKKRE